MLKRISHGSRNTKHLSYRSLLLVLIVLLWIMRLLQNSVIYALANACSGRCGCCCCCCLFCCKRCLVKWWNYQHFSMQRVGLCCRQCDSGCGRGHARPIEKETNGIQHKMWYLKCSTAIKAILLETMWPPPLSVASDAVLCAVHHAPRIIFNLLHLEA